ncbi:MAG: DUF1801 domain-containing protein [Cellvibrionaceae bacterium]
MNSTNPKVNALLSKPQWHEERKKLRAILLECQMTEEVKWGKLCYTFQESSVVMIYGMKEYCALGFFKGALLNDPKGILVKPGAHSQAMRQIRFTSLQQITAMEARVKAYIHEAIEVEKAGLKVDFKEKRELKFPEELQHKFNGDPALKKAFEALTPGRQRGYILHFSDAKQSKTRISRMEKCIPRILDGKGLNDR